MEKVQKKEKEWKDDRNRLHEEVFERVRKVY